MVALLIVYVVWGSTYLGIAVMIETMPPLLAAGARYGIAGAIVLVFWLWLTNVALLFGAELNAELEREKELAEGVPLPATLNRPERVA